jgi:nucleotide-binding universal stress UspA family protein
MIQLARILLPTDFSEFSAEATTYACAFAEQFDADLHVLHVLEIYESATPEFGLGLALPSRIEESREAAGKAMEKVLDPGWAEGRRVVQAVVEGQPFLAIIRYAKEHDVDLIVLGTHGRTGLAHVLMGSVAERVVRKAPCPVLTVRPEGHQFVMP